RGDGRARRSARGAARRAGDRRRRRRPRARRGAGAPRAADVQARRLRAAAPEAHGGRRAVTYDRDLVGYGPTPPPADWPGGARLALQIVLNYEEGGERSVLHGDAESEAFLHEVVGGPPLPDVRNLQVESVYEYGSRVGLWRLLRLFGERGVPIS